MTEIEPQFDPTTLTWFHGKKEAKTIAELLKKLGAKFTVKDYYPNGFNARQVESPPLAPVVPVVLDPREVLRGEVLDKWYAGTESNLIADAHGLTLRQVKTIVEWGRSKQDPRATIRNPKGVGPRKIKAKAA